MIFNPIVWLTCSHELLNLFIASVDEILTVLVIFRELVERTKVVRIINGIWLGSELEVFHARFNLFFISVDMWFWILILLNLWDSLAYRGIKNSKIIMWLFAFVFKYIRYSCGCNKASSLTDLRLRRCLSLKECHCCRKLERCLVASHRQVAKSSNSHGLLIFITKEISTRTFEWFLRLSDILENRIILIFLPVRNLLTQWWACSYSSLVSKVTFGISFFGFLTYWFTCFSYGIDCC